ncbi:MAG: hypothetical protein ACO1OB_13895 [Archangium sp.]
MHVLMLLVALSEPPSQVEVTVFDGTTRVKSFSSSTTLTLNSGPYVVKLGGIELGRFKVGDDVSALFDRSKLTRVNVDATSLASGAELLVRINDSISLTKPVTVFLPNGEFRVGAYGSFTVGADGVKSSSLDVSARGVRFDSSKYARVDFVVDDLSAGGVTQVFIVKDVVKLEGNATVFFADDSYELGRLGKFTTKKGRVATTGALLWDDATHSLRADKKALDRVSLDFTAFQRGMGSPDALPILDVQTTARCGRLIGSGSAFLPRGTYSVAEVLGTFATTPVASTTGGLSPTITADPTLLVPLKLTGKREFHVAPFTRSRSTWTLSLPKGRYALRSPDGRALTELIVDPPRASLTSTSGGITLTADPL